MPEYEANFNEILVSPVQDMIRKIGDGIAEAQKHLDAAALESQKKLAGEYPELDAIGYQVTWYQMPEVELEMKMAVHLERTGQGTGKGKLFMGPFNAKYKSAYKYEADGASTLKMKIVPIPPPQLVSGGDDKPE